VRFQKFMWHNMMRSTKNKKASVLHYSLDNNNNNNNKTMPAIPIALSFHLVF
jgi:hypothetical protein